MACPLLLPIPRVVRRAQARAALALLAGLRLSVLRVFLPVGDSMCLASIRTRVSVPGPRKVVLAGNKAPILAVDVPMEADVPILAVREEIVLREEGSVPTSPRGRVAFREEANPLVEEVLQEGIPRAFPTAIVAPLAGARGHQGEECQIWRRLRSRRLGAEVQAQRFCLSC